MTEPFVREPVVTRPFVRDATRRDLVTIVELLADDPLGQAREQPGEPLPDAYVAAFDAIEASPDHRLLVVDDGTGHVVGCAQVSFLPHLTHGGSWRAQIEGVRIASSQRGSGLGHVLIGAAVDAARARGCRLVQLTTDVTRPDARRFYESLGFVATHHGMKRRLDT